MAALVPVALSYSSGGPVGLTAAAVGGDTFKNNGKTLFLVSNGGGGSVTVTFVAQNQFNVDGVALAAANIAIAVGAGELNLMPPLPPQIFNNSSGSVSVTYSGVSSLLVCPLVIP